MLRLYKIASLASILSVLVVFGCNTSDQESDGMLSVKNRNGGVIITKDKLQQWTEAFVFEKYGDKSFEIISVDTRYGDGDLFSSMVSLTRPDRSHDHYLIANFSQADNARTANDPCNFYRITCDGSSCCALTGSVNSPVFTCGCSNGGGGCSMGVKCVDAP